jgi:hypothetical protein
LLQSGVEWAALVSGFCTAHVKALFWWTKNTLPILRQRDDKYLVAASKWLPAFNCRVGTIFVQLDRGWLTRRSVWTLEWVSNWLVHGPPGTSRSYMVDTAWIR